MKNPDVEICSLIEFRMNETIQEINKTDSVFDSDKLHSDLRILDWIFFQVCVSQQSLTDICDKHPHLVLKGYYSVTLFLISFSIVK